MARNGIFQNGLFSMGFDMSPSSTEIFDIGAAGSASATTPFGTGFSWTTNGSPGKTLGVNLVTLIAGIRYNCTLPTTSGIIMNFQDVTANASQVTLRAFNDGSFRFFLGTGTGTPLGSASATGLFNGSTWIYLEAKVKIDATTGTVELRVNGNTTPVITASSLNTKSTANVWVSGFIVQSTSGATYFFDDWYMLDTTGASPLDTYLGNIRVLTDKPSGAGAHTQFTPTNPTNVNYTNVGNTPALTTEYNSDGTAGDIDSYAFPNLPANVSSVIALNHWYKTELDAAGVRTVVSGCRSGGSDFFDSTAQTPPNGTYKYFNTVWEKDPNTSSAWTTANAQSAELAVKINT
jgi:hypothetical protein